MDNDEKLVAFMENSFLSGLLREKAVTDISWNGESIFYMDNAYGLADFCADSLSY